MFGGIRLVECARVDVSRDRGLVVWCALPREEGVSRHTTVSQCTAPALLSPLSSRSPFGTFARPPQSCSRVPCLSLSAVCATSATILCVSAVMWRSAVPVIFAL